jgi:hypothetical protein
MENKRYRKPFDEQNSNLTILLKKIIFKSVLLVLTALLALNLYAYHNLSDASPCTELHASVPDIRDPANKDLLICTYEEKTSHQRVFLQRFFIIDGYKFLFYKPTSVSNDFVVSLGNTIKDPAPSETKIAALDSSGKWTNLNNFSEVDFIPTRLIVKKSANDSLVFYPEEFNSANFSYPYHVPFFRKLTVGPITEKYWWI